MRAMFATFTLTHRVEFAETDMAGIVHFSNFFRMMENTEHALFRSLGHSIHAAREGETTGWPRVKASCEYLQPLRFEEEVAIRLEVAEVRTRSVRYGFTFSRVRDGAAVAKGEFTTVCARVREGKLESIPVPDTLRQALLAAS